VNRRGEASEKADKEAGAPGGKGTGGIPAVAPSITARYVGVWRKAGGAWKASLWKGDNGQKRTVHLGAFRSAKAAALAYDRAAVAARGHLARTNFPISDELAASALNSAAHVELAADSVAQAWSTVDGKYNGHLSGRYIGIQRTSVSAFLARRFRRAIPWLLILTKLHSQVRQPLGVLRLFVGPKPPPRLPPGPVMFCCVR
jgi:hypothetical protein